MNGSNFDRLETILRLEGEPDRVPFFEIYIDKEIMEALSGEPRSLQKICLSMAKRHRRNRSQS
ncbi:MAG: hypothetical protein QXR42_08515 [Candidatus Bathyarchaeia archaeon]